MDSRSLRLLDYFQVLHHLKGFARSEAGAQACADLRPIHDRSVLEKELQELREAVDAASEVLRAVTSFPDIHGVLSLLEQESAVDEDGLWGLFVFLQAARQAKRILSGLGPEQYTGLHARLCDLHWPERTWQGLNRCLDPEGGLKDESSPELLSVRQEVRRMQSQCTKKVTDYLQQTGITPYLQDDYLTISADRYVLAIRSDFKGRLQGIIHDYSQTGETCYFEPMLLVELNNTLQELRQEEREARQRVLCMLSSLASQDRDRKSVV